MYEIKTRISYSQVDKSGKLSFKALLNLFQDCALFHTEDTVAPLENMMENRVAWFLVSYRIMIHKLPAHGEIVSVKTCTVRLSNVLGDRIFFLEDNKGDILVEAYSQWIYMNLAKMKPERIPQNIVDGYGIDIVDTGKWKGRKIPVPDMRKEAGRFTVTEMYLDVNGHMNNTYYAEFAMNVLKNRNFNSVRIEYRAQAVLGDEIIACVDENGDCTVVSLESKDKKIFSVLEFSNV